MFRSIRRQIEEKIRSIITARQMERRRANLEKRLPELVLHPAYYQRVNQLTNYQRNQWARAGYPGQNNKGGDFLKIIPYSLL